MPDTIWVAVKFKEKVVLRSPIRIAIDTGQPGIERLRPGMSVVTRTDTFVCPQQRGGHTEPSSLNSTQGTPAY